MFPNRDKITNNGCYQKGRKEAVRIRYTGGYQLIKSFFMSLNSKSCPLKGTCAVKSCANSNLYLLRHCSVLVFITSILEPLIHFARRGTKRQSLREELRCISLLFSISIFYFIICIQGKTFSFTVSQCTLFEINVIIDPQSDMFFVLQV